ncbi:hypothetical protein BGP_1053 [Beggiatoa sp. PS]|nr:hypothetical protein BGP_1053 [Beggiatoa sp. PS]
MTMSRTTDKYLSGKDCFNLTVIVSESIKNLSNLSIRYKKMIVSVLNAGGLSKLTKILSKEQSIMKSQHYASTWQTIVFAFIVALGLLNVPVNGWAATDCTTVTEIPQIECEALVALYESTDGPNWTDSPDNNWNVINTPCSWEGITCEAGHVTKISRRHHDCYNGNSYKLRGISLLKLVI